MEVVNLSPSLSVSLSQSQYPYEAVYGWFDAQMGSKRAAPRWLVKTRSQWKRRLEQLPLVLAELAHQLVRDSGG